MNLFMLDYNIAKSAKCLDDRRLNKMVTETAQLMCAGIASFKIKPAPPYKITHANHPLTVWTTTNKNNLVYLAYYIDRLNQEYDVRKSHNRQHMAYTKLLPHIETLKRFSIDPDMTFVNCAAHAEYGLNFKHMEDVEQAYRLYITQRWRIEIEGGYKPIFTNRLPPEWLDKSIAKQFRLKGKVK